MNNQDQPAFPMYNELGNLYAVGLTKREYFAAMAMQGLISNGAPRVFEDVCERAIKFADTLLTQLNPAQKP